MDDELRDALDYLAITRLQAAYADSVTRRAWREFHDMFLVDAPVSINTVTNPVIELTGPQQVGEFIGAAIERFEFFEFTILNTHVELRADGRDDHARARVYICELRQDAATGHFTQAFGLYRDHYRRVEIDDGGSRAPSSSTSPRPHNWWFARRDYQSLARTGRNEVFALPSNFEA